MSRLRSDLAISTWFQTRRDPKFFMHYLASASISLSFSSWFSCFMVVFSSAINNASYIQDSLSCTLTTAVYAVIFGLHKTFWVTGQVSDKRVRVCETNGCLHKLRN